MTEKIKVMIVDDSALVRQVVSQALATDPGIEVIATASDPIFALEKMKAHWPDVLIIDIEMPRMDGITFLKKIMAEHPTPTVVCSSLAEQGARATFEALAAGALTIITKPKIGLKSFLEDASNDIVQAVRSAARANMRAMLKTRAMSSALPSAPVNRPKLTADAMLSPTANRALERTTDQVVAIVGRSSVKTGLVQVLGTWQSHREPPHDC